MAIELYFNCEWSTTPRASPKAWMTTTRPTMQQQTDIGSVKWRGKEVTVHLIAVGPAKVLIDKSREKYPPDLYALLKSNLQKQVRRGKMTAIATAARLLELGEFEFLRRLVVIAAEDAEVSTETTIVTWLMAARSKGLQLFAGCREWLLGYVKKLVQYPTCRRLEIKPERDDYDPDLTPEYILYSEHSQCKQIAGILFRCAYGGLHSDPPMISRCLDWLLVNEEELPSLDVKPFTAKLPKLLINPAAIDHHIWYGLIEELAERHPDYAEEFLCTVVWECSSGYNYRKKRPKQAEWTECWKKIKPDFKELTRGYLGKILERHQL